ncbi:nucleoside phosphorylase [Leptolinea tardivitalis]|uniref:nucleoside phosphorylase n=1 Tax=Leptolinea tardivitalis TaxID=229920 RepID=UPI00078201A5|nr:nucleoside phosphorylase [Leptolinea tardivitalis]GAP21000.1 uridine phosphorylase [Leptolinea tardivitalis]
MSRKVEEGRKGLSDAELGGDIEIAIKDEIKDYSGYMLMPGDPDRISVMAGQWENAKEFPQNRGYRAALGVYQGAKISALTSGIGAPSLEYKMTEAAELGAHTIIRVGSTGAIQEGIENGDLIINDACIRLDGMTPLYVRPEFPAAASYEVTMALIEAAETFGYRYHVGTGCTSASFFAGQGRTSFGGFKLSSTDAFFDDIRRLGVLNFEMEAAALLTLARLFKIRAGIVASVIAQRLTGKWDDAGGEERACRVGAEALRILTGWDQKKKKAGKLYYFPTI